MSERVKPERVKCQRTLPAELSSPSDAAISRLPMSARRSFGASDASDRTARVGKSGVAWGLLRKADALLEEAIGAGDPADRFRCAYLAALRGAGAVLAAAPAGAGSKRKRSGNAWVLMDAAAPAFGAWSKFFAGWSATRAAVETGVSIVITDSRFRRILRRGRPFSRRSKISSVRTRPSICERREQMVRVGSCFREFPGPHRQMEPNRGPSARIRTLVAELVPGVGGPRPKLLVL
ncbi:SAV_6107 family HEPN domain-containing protein [Rhodococcus sp. 3Y1]